MKKAKQAERVLRFIREHGSVTQRDAVNIGIYRLSARIYDLKKAGIDIRAELEPVKNADGTKTYIAVYREGARA